MTVDIGTRAIEVKKAEFLPFTQSGHVVATLGSRGHTLRVEATGMRPYQSEVVVQDGEKRAKPTRGRAPIPSS